MMPEKKHGRRSPFRLFSRDFSFPFSFVVCLVLFAGMAGLVACSSDTSVDSTDVSDDSDESAFSAIAAVFDAAVLDLDYSDRDQDASYDDESSTRILLSGMSATVEGSGAEAEGSTVTITTEGTYLVSGELDDGQLVVDTSEDAKVQVVLAGSSIHNEDGPALYVRQADKCFITLADGSTNTLTDGAQYALEDDSDEPYATLFSRDDLTINGAGTLQVTSSYRHAICSKDDLVITGGSYVIDAAEDALRGRDCVKIRDGNFTIAAQGDGIKSNNDTDATRGFVSIDGGAFDITAGDDGVQSVTYLRVAGGQMKVVSDDDAFHSDLEIILAGGEMTVDAGDDAFHAETKLVVDEGTVDVSSCYEGYEAEKVYVNGGSSRIVASDDAVNASSASLDDDAEVDVASSSDAPDAGGAPPDGTVSSDGSMTPSTSDGEEPRTPPDQDGSMGDPTVGNGPFPGDEDSTPDKDEAVNGNEPDDVMPGGRAGEGMGGGMTAGDEDCLIQINGGYLVLDSTGDAIDSNGSVEISGGVLLVNGPTSNGDGAFDYDLAATVSGGTVLMLGSTGMAQNFTDGTQPFAFSTTSSGTAGQSVAVVDDDGNVVVSLLATKEFEMVLASSPSFTEGGTYSLVIGGTVSNADDDGYTDEGTVSGGQSCEIIASTSPVTDRGGGGNVMGPDQGEERR